MNVHDLIKQARRDNGVTAAYNGVGYTPQTFTSGFMVSIPKGIENLPNRALISAVIEAFLDGNDLAWDLAYLGLWQDGEGDWSVDMSFHVEDRETAIRTGIAYGQRAIWDCANGSAINLD